MTFPERLPKQIEKEMIKRAGSGDQMARNMIIEHNLRLIPAAIKAYVDFVRDYDDRFSIGCEALIRAVDSYNPSLGNLSTYFSKCLKNRMVSEVKRDYNPKNVVSMDAPVHKSDEYGDPLTGHDVIGNNFVSPLSKIIENESRTEMYKALESIPRKHRTFLEMRYLTDGGLSQRELAAKIGRPRSWVITEERRSLTQCRQTMNVKN